MKRAIAVSGGAGIGREPESVQPSDQFACDQHTAIFFQPHIGDLVVAQMFHQNGSPAIDETLDQPLMQGIG